MDVEGEESVVYQLDKTEAAAGESISSYALAALSDGTPLPALQAAANRTPLPALQAAANRTPLPALQAAAKRLGAEPAEEKRVWTDDEIELYTKEVTRAITYAHAGASRHFSKRCTMLRLNALYPGHRIPYRMVLEVLGDCAACQKAKHHMLPKDRLQSLEPTLQHVCEWGSTR